MTPRERKLLFAAIVLGAIAWGVFAYSIFILNSPPPIISGVKP